MTEEEKKSIVDAVIAQLKKNGTDISDAEIVTDASGISSILCYSSSGDIVKITPDALSSSENDISEVVAQLSAQIAEIRANAMHYDTLGVSVYPDKAEIYGRSIYGTPRTFEFPAATTTKAGVMSAEDKNALENVNSVINIGEYPNIQAVWDACKQIALNHPEISIIKYSVKAGVTYNSGVVFQSYHYNDAVVTQYYLYGGGHKHECNVRHIVSDGTTDEWQPIQIFTSYKFENGTLYGYKYGESESEQNKVAIVSIPIGSAVAELIQEVTYSELVALRDNAGLVAGMKYRITDYVTTTVQKDTKSANHPFDVIVEAVSENELSELAQAIQHEGDTYFDGNDLGAWQLWYSLDNDTEKYAWADAENGKGVIYYMKDERDNECPYDFKNIMFKDYFTFSYMVDGVIYDGTVRSEVKSCYGNIIKHRWIGGMQHLNDIVFKNTSFSHNCYFNTFDNDCYRNTFGSGCYSNTFGSGCSNNTFGSSCSNNTFGNGCSNNTFGNDCYRNTFGNNCYDRRIDGSKLSITLNDEYYDDGTNALVPIKHPDLSTQPSILPYKFMGQYVYEQLIPNIEITNSYDIQNTFAVKKPLIISANSIGGIASMDAKPNWWIDENTFNIETSGVYDFMNVKFFRIVYTSMPEEGDNYGYNNY